MDWGFLSFLAEPAFVVPWYLLGLALAVWVAYDLYRVNVHVGAALKWAWPVILLFFSGIGLAAYLLTSRSPGTGKLEGEEARREHKNYVDTMPRKVTASIIHCVGGDGLGIITAMVVARVWSFAFWNEFWFEYAAGFAFGWFIFQYKAMRSMGHPPMMSLWMGGRAEFFSMMTVMAGMGLVMAYITPAVVGQQPTPDTFGFWGFAALGLMAGWVATIPTNYVLVRIGWKHGTA